MPKQKENRRPKFLYPYEAMKQALAAVRSGICVMEASKRYNVPRSTLIYKSSGKSPVERKMGPRTVLSEKYEKLLVNWIMQMARRGFPIVKWDLLSYVEKIVREMDIPNPFTNGKPGKKWLNLFLKRHPSIAKRVVEKLTTSRAAVTESNLRNWFNETKSLLTDEGHFDILKDSDRVFNTDESAFMLCPKSEKVLGIRGQKNVYEVSGANDKESLTVLITANASGVSGPTLIVFPYVRLPAEITKTVPPEWAIGKSDKGWMNAENFYEYIANSFHPWLVSSGIQLPVLLFLDGHSSHLTLHLSKFCSDNGIVLVSLYPNATHIIQPLDVSVFRPLKLGWQKTVHSWKMQNIHQHLTKYNFAPLLEHTIKNYLSKDALINGFRLCGLHPFNENAVDYSKCANFSTGQRTIPENIQNSTTGQTKSTFVYLESKMRLETITAFNSFFEKDQMKKWVGENEELYDVWKSFRLDHVSTNSLNLPDNDESISIEPTPSTSRTQNDAEITTQNKMVMTVHSPQRCNTASITYNSTPEPAVPIQITRLTTGEKLAKVISPATNGQRVPTPFKRILFWPGTPPKTKKMRKNKTVKIPSVVSSKTWQQYFERKNADKEEK